MSDDTPGPAQLRIAWLGSASGEVHIHHEEPRARRTDPETSHQAAESMVEGAANQRAEIMRVLDYPTRRGFTADELDEYIGWRPTTAGRRLIELERQGLVERTDEKRKTRSGRWAYVWRAR